MITTRNARTPKTVREQNVRTPRRAVQKHCTTIMRRCLKKTAGESQAMNFF